MKSYLIKTMLVLFTSAAWCNVVVTAAETSTITNPQFIGMSELCRDTLYELRITESNAGDFNDVNQGTYTIQLPTGFVFANTNNHSPTITVSTISGTAPTTFTLNIGPVPNNSNTYTFQYTLAGSANGISEIKISKLTIRCNLAKASGEIAGGSSTMEGNSLNEQPHGYLSNTPPLLMNSTILCEGSEVRLESVLKKNNATYKYWRKVIEVQTTNYELKSNQTRADYTYEIGPHDKTFYIEIIYANTSCTLATEEKTLVVDNRIESNTITSTNQNLCNANNGNNPSPIIGSIATGSHPVVYTWQYSFTTDTWFDLPNSNTSIYDPPGISQITYYRRKAVSGSICDESYSDTIEIIPGIIDNTISTTKQNYCIDGNTVVFELISGSIATGQNTIQYQWQIKNGNTYVNIPGATERDYRPLQLTSTQTYRRRASSGNCPNVSNEIIITVNSNLDLTDKNPGNPYIFERSDSDKKDLSNLVNIPANYVSLVFTLPSYPGAISDQKMFTTSAVPPGEYKFEYVLTNAGGCVRTGVFPKLNNNQTEKYITVRDPSYIPVFFSTNQGYPVCENGASFGFSLNLSGPLYSTETTNGALTIRKEQLFTKISVLEKNQELVLYNNAQGKKTHTDNIQPQNHNNFSIPFEVIIAERTTTLLAGTNQELSSSDRFFTERWSIPVVPRRNPMLTGLPNPIDEIHYICSASLDTITLVPNQADGDFIFKIVNGPSIPSSLIKKDGYNFKFVPRSLFDSLQQNLDVVLSINYKVPGSGNFNFCPDEVNYIVRFQEPYDVSFEEIDDIHCQDVPVRLLTRVPSIPATFSFQWFWGDGSIQSNTSSSSEFSHQYALPGEYKVRLKTSIPENVSGALCHADFQKTITVSAKPKASFDVFNNIKGEEARIKSTSQIGTSGTSFSDPIQWYVWRINGVWEEDSLSKEIKPVIEQSGMVEIIHYVVATKGCSDTVRRAIPWFSVFPVSSQQKGYNESFDSASPESWFHSGQYYHTEDQHKSSWQLGNQYFKNGTGNFWSTTGNSSSVPADRNKNEGYSRYFNDEQSYVESPCFDLEKFSAPVLSIKQRYHADLFFDGANIQYTFCDSAFLNEKWYNLGSYEGGLEWYNAFAIVSKPGDLIEGWSGSSDEWKLSAHSLGSAKSMMEQNPSRKYVRFRINFGSNGDNKPGNLFDGFAFDDFVIDNINRNVLIESFVSEKKQDSLQSIAGNSQSIVIKHYVWQEAEDMDGEGDLPYQFNKADGPVRSLFYGVDTLPKSIMDGIERKDEYFSNWGTQTFERRRLLVSPFELEIGSVSIENGTLIIPAMVRQLKNIADKKPYALMFAIVNRRDSSLIKLLPNAAGIRIRPEDWTGAQVSLPAYRWKPILGLDYSEGIQIIAYLQDESSKEILQAVQKSLPYSELNGLQPASDPSITQGLQRRTWTQLPPVQLFPNPVLQQLSLEFSWNAPETIHYTIQSYQGIQVLQGQLPEGSLHCRVPVQELPPGFYNITLRTSGDSQTINFIKQ
ncbi:MAG: T9SS type A sorting domain-containing protein [Cytophagaceae bacterium]|nr:T9SS type A sorting domain-containing protein [Cytophagaceae bacterium]